MRTDRLLVLLLFAGSYCWGDGAFVGLRLTARSAAMSGVASTAQKGIVIELPEGREALLLQTTYHGPADRFAWVIPVPGRPGEDDVFLASTDFIDEVLRHTQPEVETSITLASTLRDRPVVADRGVLLDVLSAGAGKPGSPEHGGGPPSRRVTVYERMAVGDYDAAVLGATGPEVLLEWLAENGFSMPPAAGGVLQHYVGKGWYFVAIRMQPAAAARTEVLTDVAPIGIRFPTPRLVYPLTISRVSSREKTSLLVVALARGPVSCPEVRLFDPPLKRWLDPGSSYGGLRRQAVAGKGLTAICEYRGPRGVPFTDLYYRQDRWFTAAEPGWEPEKLWATRLWSLVDREALVDLTFTPAAERAGSRLVVERQCVLSEGASERFLTFPEYRCGLLAVAGLLGFLAGVRALRRGWCWDPEATAAAGAAVALLGLAHLLDATVVVWAFVVCLLCCVGARIARATLRRPDAPRPDPLSRRATIVGAMLAAGFGMLGYPALLVLSESRALRAGTGLGNLLHDVWLGIAPPGVRIAAAAVPIGCGLLALAWVIAGLRGGGQRAMRIALAAVPIGSGLLALAWVIVGLRGGGLRGVWALGSWLAFLFAGRGAFAERRAHALLDSLSGGAFALSGWPPAHSSGDWFALSILAWVIVTLGLVVGFVIVGPYVSTRSHARAQAVAGAFAAIMAVDVLFVAAVGSRLGPSGADSRREIEERLDARLETIDDALREYARAYGCYPRTLADLTGPGRPTEGVDSSGNQVVIAPAAAEVRPSPPRGPDAEHTPADFWRPADPLTGRIGTWVYDPTATPMVDSGGYRVRIWRERLAATGGRPSHYDPVEGRRGPHYHVADASSDAAQRDSYYGRPSPIADVRAFDYGGGRGAALSKVLRSPGATWRILSGSAAVVQVAADAASDAGSWVKGRPGLDAADLSPDGRRVAFALRRRGMSSQLFVGANGDANPSELLPAPWRMHVLHIDWHPRQDAWLVVGNDCHHSPNDGDLYEIGANRRPRPLTHSGAVWDARYAPDGASVFALIVAGDRRPRLIEGEVVPTGSLELWQLSLSGESLQRLLPQITPGAFDVGAAGCIAAGRSDAGDRLVMCGAGGAETVTLPFSARDIVDLWMDTQVVLVVHRPPLGDSRHDTGYLWRYRRAARAWQRLAQYHVTYWPGSLRILGRDPRADAALVCHRTAPVSADVGMYAIRDGGGQPEGLLVDRMRPSGGPFEPMADDTALPR